MRYLNQLAGYFYSLKYNKRLTYKDACQKLSTPFKMYSYQLRWFKYRKNEDSKYNCLLPEEVWSDDMLDPDTGKHYDDCDGYAAAAIDPLREHDYDCEYLVMFSKTSGHATLLIHTKKQEQTLGTFGLVCHKKKSPMEIAHWFYDDLVCVYVADRDWRVTSYIEVFEGQVYQFHFYKEVNFK